MAAGPAPAARGTPLILRAWRAKVACSLGILAYYLGGYFTLNRLPHAKYHDVIPVPILDDLPILPWTVLIYNSVFVLGALGIWLHSDPRSVKRYFVSVLVAYTLNYMFFALIPTRLDRAPIPEGSSIWIWVLERIREIDGPYTCFPSLHITNCFVVVLSFRQSRLGPWFLAWSLAIAASTLTTDQHLFLDLPAGAFMAVLGHAVGKRIVR